MGHGFGQLYHLRNIITYRLSPYEQRPFAGFVKHGFPNTIRRMAESFLYFVPPMVLGYLAYDQVERAHKRMSRKDPKEFENDK